MKTPNEVETQENTRVEPLHSILPEQDPEFAEILRQFIRKLPDLIITIETRYRAHDWQQLIAAVHNLKGMGGGFGFPQLTERAAEIEKLLNLGDYPRIASVIEELHVLSKRIQAGQPK